LFTFKDPNEKRAKPQDPEVLAKKLGKNPKLLNRLDSVVKVKHLQPLLSGKQKLLDIPQQKQSDEENSETSENEKNKDFFESMVYWKFEENRKQGTKKLQLATEQKELRKKNQINSQANSYEI
jgi:hypothetical protein